MLAEIAMKLRQRGYSVEEYHRNSFLWKIVIYWNGGKQSRIITDGKINDAETTRTKLNNELLFIDWEKNEWRFEK